MDDRRIVSAILFVIKNGLRWRDAPPGYGPHNSPLTKSFSADSVLSSSFGGESAMAMGRSDGVKDDLMATWAECAVAGPCVLRSAAGPAWRGWLDAFVEQMCKPYYAARMGAPSLPPGRYFRMHMIGYFEGIDSERGIAWRCATRLAARFPWAVEPRQGSRSFLAVADPFASAARGAREGFRLRVEARG